MNKVITINLDGIAYQLEEGGYEALRTYLEAAAARLQGNPDKDEIISDIERALGEKFRALLGSHKTVVVTSEVATALAEMGPIEADAEPDAGAAPEPDATRTGAPKGNPPGGPGPDAGAASPRRLYRITENAMISGVCNGIAAYLGLDPTLIRLAFVLLTMLGGSGLLVYVIMVAVVPEARSAGEKAAASGDPATAQEFIRRAKQGYYDSIKGFPDRQARHEWQRRFQREMRAHAARWRYQWRGCRAEDATVHPGMGVALPFLSVLQGIATVLWICATVSLLGTGEVLGVPLPANVPVWAAAVLLLIAYGILVGPLKATRHLCYRGMVQPRWSWSIVFLLDGMVSLVVFSVLLLLAVHYFPELREAIRSFPALAHQAAVDMRTRWKGN